MVCITTPELSAKDTIGQWVWLGKVLPFSAGCVIVVSLIQLCERVSWKKALYFPDFFVFLSWSLMFFGVLEAVWGMRQLYGFTASGHFRYALTGSFFNPGPYAGYLAIVLPICLHYYMRISDEWRWLCKSLEMKKMAVAIAGILILSVLPATMSRTAWVAAAISCFWVAYMHRDKRKWNILWHRYKKRYLLWGAGIFLILSLTVAGMFFLKPDSALGRLFMWKITCRAIANHPWGCQPGFAFAYGEAQSLYFASGDYAAWEERVAGSPEYAFNEYLEFALKYGIAVCILVMALIFGCLWMGVKRHRYGICGALISLLVFSFSSYPLHLPAFIIAGVCLLLACGVGDVIGKPLILCICVVLWAGGNSEKWKQEEDACRSWMNARILYHSGAYKAANKAYEELLPLLQKKGVFLFEYGHSLHKSGLYNESNKYLNQARQYSTDPMILNIIGKNYQEMQYYERAETFYLAAVRRLPGRIYPYYLLAKLYAEPEYRNKEKFEKMQRIVLTKEPKVYSTAIREMREEVEKTGNEWDNSI